MNSPEIPRRPDRGRGARAGAAGAVRRSTHATVSGSVEDLFTGTARSLGMMPMRYPRPWYLANDKPSSGLVRDYLVYMRDTFLAPCPECGDDDHLPGDCLL